MSVNIPLPLPYIFGGDKIDGSLFEWPERCRGCKANGCMSARDDALSCCSYGYNYQRIDPQYTVGGIYVRECVVVSKARLKLRRSGVVEIPVSSISKTATFLDKIKSTMQGNIAKQQEKVIEAYIDDKQYEVDFLSSLKPEILKGLSFVHDYKQINSQIAQNINVIIEKAYSGQNIEEKLDKASREEKAIYHASKLLAEKLNISRFLLNPELLYSRERCTKSRFHGLVLKYVRIYTPQFENKLIRCEFRGHSYLEVLANPDALSIIPHTFIDNAQKYAPRNSSIRIDVNDEANHINFRVSSLGPKLVKGERKKIFGPFYRGKNAVLQEEEGAGYGLYISQMIAQKHLGSEIQVIQEFSKSNNSPVWTTFSIKIPLSADFV